MKSNPLPAGFFSTSRAGSGLCALVLVLGLPLWAQEPETYHFKWQESGIHQIVSGQRPHAIGLSAQVPAGFKQAPAGLHAPLYGAFEMGPSNAAVTIGVILDVADNQTQRLFVDGNANGDFTDDPPCTWTNGIYVGQDGGDSTSWSGRATVVIPFASGPRRGQVNFYGPETWGGSALPPKLYHYSDFGMAGEVKLGGKVIPAVLEDGSGAGDFHLGGSLMTTPLLWLDVTNTGRSLGKGTSFSVFRPFEVDDQWWAMTNLTPDGTLQIVAVAKPASAGPNLSPGRKAPEFTARRTDGKTVKFPGDYKGKVVLLDFWAQWCGPCIAEVPNVAKAYEKYHEQGLEILGISLDREAGVPLLADFTKRKNMTWPQVCDGKFWEAEVAKLYGIRAIPHMILVDGNTGAILADDTIRGQALAPAIEKALTTVTGKTFASKDADPAAGETVSPPTAAPEPQSAGSSRLKVGDPAPKLACGKWIQGEPVTEFASNRVYIVEFWATWCGPCRASIPHLNELYQQFKDKNLVIIGQDCWEQDDALPGPFVKRMGDKMSYRVALDDKTGGGKGAMADTWMTASGQNGIPSAFIVNQQGRIVWIGHPMNLTPALVEDVLAGKFDLQKAAQAAAREEKQSANTVAGQLRSLQVGFSRQLAAAQWEAAEATLAKIDKATENFEPATIRLMYQLSRLDLFIARQDFDGAVKFSNDVMASNPHELIVQLTIADKLAHVPNVKGPALALAAKLAQDGYAQGGPTGHSFTLTLARVKMLQGDNEMAVELQTKAISESPADTDKTIRQRLQTDLETYRKAKSPASTLPRPDSSVRATNRTSAVMVRGLNPPAPPRLGEPINDAASMQFLEIEGRKLLKQPGILVNWGDRLDAKSCGLKLPAPSSRKLDTAGVVACLEPSVGLVVCFRQASTGEKVSMSTASGFFITKSGAFVTSFHVLGSSRTNGLGLSVLTRDGHICAVRDILACDPVEDLVVLQVGGDGYTPVPLARADAPAGTPVVIVSNPSQHLFAASTGIVSRQTQQKGRKGLVRFMSITADFAKGSSGAPVCDETGAVIGVVDNTQSVYYDEEQGVQENFQMTIRNCIPVSALRGIVSGAAFARKIQ